MVRSLLKWGMENERKIQQKQNQARIMLVSTFPKVVMLLIDVIFFFNFLLSFFKPAFSFITLFTMLLHFLSQLMRQVFKVLIYSLMASCYLYNFSSSCQDIATVHSFSVIFQFRICSILELQIYHLEWQIISISETYFSLTFQNRKDNLNIFQSFTGFGQSIFERFELISCFIFQLNRVIKVSPIYQKRRQLNFEFENYKSNQKSQQNLIFPRVLKLRLNNYRFFVPRSKYFYPHSFDLVITNQMYGNSYRRPCKFGPECRYLRRGTCWYYHPDWHEDADMRTFNNFYGFNTISSSRLNRLDSETERFDFQRQRRLRQERERKQKQEEQQRQREREMRRKRQLQRQMQMRRERESVQMDDYFQTFMKLLMMSQKKKQMVPVEKVEEQEEKKHIKINGKDVKTVKINSKLEDSKKWFFEKSNHFHYFQECGHEVCPICLNKFEKQEIVSSLYCNHVFHNDCIEKWLQKSQKCPMCRQQFNKHQAFKTMKGYQKPIRQVNRLLLLENFLQ